MLNGRIQLVQCSVGQRAGRGSHGQGLSVWWKAAFSWGRKVVGMGCCECQSWQSRRCWVMRALGSAYEEDKHCFIRTARQSSFFYPYQRNQRTAPLPYCSYLLVSYGAPFSWLSCPLKANFTWRQLGWQRVLGGSILEPSFLVWPVCMSCTRLGGTAISPTATFCLADVHSWGDHDVLRLGQVTFSAHSDSVPSPWPFLAYSFQHVGSVTIGLFGPEKVEIISVFPDLHWLFVQVCAAPLS